MNVAGLEPDRAALSCPKLSAAEIVTLSLHWKKVACGAFFETLHSCRRQKRGPFYWERAACADAWLRPGRRF